MIGVLIEKREKVMFDLTDKRGLMSEKKVWNELEREFLLHVSQHEARNLHLR